MLWEAVIRLRPNIFPPTLFWPKKFALSTPLHIGFRQSKHSGTVAITFFSFNDQRKLQPQHPLTWGSCAFTSGVTVFFQLNSNTYAALARDRPSHCSSEVKKWSNLCLHKFYCSGVWRNNLFFLLNIRNSAFWGRSPQARNQGGRMGR